MASCSMGSATETLGPFESLSIERFSFECNKGDFCLRMREKVKTFRFTTFVHALRERTVLVLLNLATNLRRRIIL